MATDPRRALDELDALVRRMWRGSLRHPHKQHSKWQVSQVHVAHDIANTTISLEQLDRYVSRSRRQSVFEAAQADLHTLYVVVDGRRDEDEPDLIDSLPDVPWEDAFLPDEDEFIDPFLYDEDPLLGRCDTTEPTAAEERSAQVYRWGKRISGVTWSPGGAISFVQYDKTLEGRLRNKRFMEPIWRSAGWDGAGSVIRHEARLRRDGLRTLGLPAETWGSLDDPWTFLEHIGEVWGYVVGQVPHLDDATSRCATTASQVDVAWIRRVIPDVDTNRSRWPTDPVWQLVQAAPFAGAPTKSRRLMRRERHAHAIEQLDAGAYGYLVSRTALLHPKGETFDVSVGLHGLFDALTTIATQPDKDFGALVRQRRRKRGLPVVPANKVLPLLPAWSDDDPARGAALDAAADAVFDDDASADELHAARLRLAERRMAEALLALEEVSLGTASAREVAHLERVFTNEVSVFQALLHDEGGS